MAVAVFPPGGPGVKYPAPNGIVYVWDDTNGRWTIESKSKLTSSLVHVGISQPSSSAEGDLWYDTSDNDTRKLKIYVNSDWEEAAPGWQEYQYLLDSMLQVWYGDDPPTDPSYQFWFDETELELCVLHGGMWWPANPINIKTPTLNEVLNASPGSNLTNQDIVLTNGGTDAIDISPTTNSITLASVDDTLMPRISFLHTGEISENATRADIELDEEGRTLDFDCEGVKIEDMRFRFENDVKFQINKSGDAEFLGKVKASDAIESSELTTLAQIQELSLGRKFVPTTTWSDVGGNGTSGRLYWDNTLIAWHPVDATGMEVRIVSAELGTGDNPHFNSGNLTLWGYKEDTNEWRMLGCGKHDGEVHVKTYNEQSYYYVNVNWSYKPTVRASEWPFVRAKIDGYF